MLPDDFGFPVAYTVAASTSAKIGTVTLSYSYQERFLDAPRQYQWTPAPAIRLQPKSTLARLKPFERDLLAYVAAHPRCGVLQYIRTKFRRDALKHADDHLAAAFDLRIRGWLEVVKVTEDRYDGWELTRTGKRETTD